MIHALTIAADAAVIFGCVFAISGLFALGLGATLGRAAKLGDEAMLAYLDEQYAVETGDEDGLSYDVDAYEWIEYLRGAA